MNPYWGKNFFSFFYLFLKRSGDFLTGKLSLNDLASDEVQILVLCGVALSSVLVGTFLIYRRMTMLANSLSHTILLGIVISYLIAFPSSFSEEMTLGLEQLFFASLITGFLTVMLTQVLTQVLKIQEDASIGLVFTTLFALGIVLVTVYTRNMHVGVEAIMGNVDALHVSDLRLISCVTGSNLLVFTCFFKHFELTTFDSGLSKSFGVPTSFFNYLLMFMTAATVIGAFRAVGVLLVLALLVGPVLTASLITHRLSRILWFGAGIGVGCSIVSVALSRHCLSAYQVPLSTAGLLVALIAFVFLLTVFYRIVQKKWVISV